MGFSPQKILNISQKIAKFMVHRHLSRARHAKFIAEMWPARVLLDPRLQDDDSRKHLDQNGGKIFEGSKELDFLSIPVGIRWILFFERLYLICWAFCLFDMESYHEMRTVATKFAEYKKVIVLSYCGSIHATQVFQLKTSLNTLQPPKPISNFCFAPPCRFKTVWYFISGFSLPLTLLVFIFFLRQVRLDINDVKDGQTEDLGGQRAMQCPFARDKRPLILSIWIVC